MARERVNVVWLKKDLRLQDHEPLMRAEQSELPYIIIYLFEPGLMAHPDCSTRHLQFIYHSLLEMQRHLLPYNLKVHIVNAEAIEAFQIIQSQYDIVQVFSHQESGIQLSWERDKKVAQWFKELDIIWKESQRDGILRGIKNRDDWDKQWYSNINLPLIKNEFTVADRIIHLNHSFELEASLLNDLSAYPNQFQPAGETNAWKYLKSFTADRGKNYQRHISKPSESRTSCGRISPYLSWGNISIKQAVHHVKLHPNYEHNKRAFNGILTRLKWHCHFIQKFEVECEYETDCINRGYELLNRDQNPAFLKAWKTGKTGYPLVDACMRCLIETGWINFRMRAMLVSFLCHHLDQDWRDGVYFLARQFLDYEPGIHYPQFQMQAGTTGINTVRMYNPIKQSMDHDPEGHFIKKWVKELEDIPTEFIHEPFKMTSMEQNLYGLVLDEDYPSPIVDLAESGKKARAKIWGHRKHPTVKEENQRILATHVRRNTSQSRTNRKKRT
ncbi:MAG: deoxyribodipyrimidine photo-lyase [Crocinitomicaceae bacterium]